MKLPKPRIKWLLIPSGLVILLAFSGWFIATNPVGAYRMNDLPEPDVNRVREHVTALINSGGFRNYRNPEILDRVAAYIQAVWIDQGLTVTEQPFEAEGKTYRNVIAVYGPEDAERLVIGAHYDVFANTDGADDNASGVAAILELGQLLSAQQPKVRYRIELVAFSLEEPPFFRSDDMGSAKHAASLAESNAPVKAMIALDMVGFYSEEPGSQKYPIHSLKHIYPKSGNFLCVIGNLEGFGLVRKVKSRIKGACSLNTRSFNAPTSIRGIDASDHLQYWKQGYNAVLISDTAYYRNRNYHGPKDTIDTLDFDKITEVAKGLYGVVTTF